MVYKGIVVVRLQGFPRVMIRPLIFNVLFVAAMFIPRIDMAHQHRLLSSEDTQTCTNKKWGCGPKGRDNPRDTVIFLIQAAIVKTET